MAEYDAAYKRLFESARLVEDLLREALAEHPEFIDAIDFTTMRRLPGELITESLHKRFIDSVWQIDQIGQRSSVVVILEFQSNVDADMGLRMLAYSSVLLQSLIGQERSRSTLTRSYPILVPMVLYNGKPSWSAALDVRERFDVIEDGLLRYQPSQRYMLVEEKQWVGPLPGHCALFRALVNIIHSTNPEQVASALATVDACLDDERDRRLKQGIADLFEASAREEYLGFDKLPEGMTMGELHNALLDSMREWPREWVEKGRKEGQEIGQAEGVRSVLQDLLSQKFGELPESVSEQIRRADYSQLQRWAKRVIEADSFEQILID